jgi:hypothetical protein
VSYIFPLRPRAPITFRVLPGVGAGAGDNALTAQEILNLLLTVDGTGSLLDADTVDGQHASFFADMAALQAEIARATAAEALLAPLASPAFTGTPTGPTAAPLTNNNQLATTAFVIANAGGGGGGSIPILTPEQFGADPFDGDATVTTAAFAAMMADAESAGGAIIWLMGRYLLNAPIVFPATVPMAMMGISRSGNVDGRSCIVSVTGTHDIIKFPYGADRVYLSNFTIGHDDVTVPTAGVAIDARWLADFMFENIATYNLHNGIDFGVGRSGIVDGLYMRGFTGVTSGIGTDAYGNDCGFGVLVRSTQTLLDGNVGLETTYYDRDGSGVTVLPKAKGTSLRLRNMFINGKKLGEDEDAGGLTEEYAPNFVALDVLGASTIRVENCQLRQSENAIRTRHAPNLDPRSNTFDGETGKQQCAGIVLMNITAEACKQTYEFGGVEKGYGIFLQANGVATRGYELGDNPSGSFPGVNLPAGVSPMDEWGGVMTLVVPNALTCREEGFRVRSGIFRLIEPQVAGYSGNRPGDTEPGSAAEFTATTVSARVAFETAQTGNFTVRNDGAVSIWVRAGNSTVVATTAGPSVEVTAGNFITIVRTTETHLAFITPSSTADGEVGLPATLLASGILVKDTSVNGLWINGGVVSSNKSLKAVGNITNQGPSLEIENGAQKVFVNGLDVAEGVVDNQATLATNVQIINLKRSTYRQDPFKAYLPRDVTATTYIFVLADLERVVRSMNAASTVLTIPPNADVPFPVGALIRGIRGGAGTLTVAPGSGVTIRSENGNLSVPTRHQRFEIYQHAANDWTFSAVVPTAAGAGSVDWTAVLNKPSVFPFEAATQAEAEAGVENTKGMTSLRVAQAIDAQVAGAGLGDVTGPAGGTTDAQLAVFDDTTGKLIRGAVSGDGSTIRALIGAPATAHTHTESDVTNLVTDLAAKVPNTRLINTTAPITGGGALSGDLTLAPTFATQAEAEAGTVTAAFMNPLRTAQAIAALAAGTSVATQIVNAAAKAVPVDADSIGIVDSEAANALKETTFAQLKAFFETYFDTQYQATDPELAAIAGLTSAADKGIQFTGSGTAATYDLTAAGKALLDDANNIAQRVTLGLEIGVSVQGYDADLSELAALAWVANGYVYTDASAVKTIGSITAAGRALLDDADATAQLATLGAAAASHTHTASQVTDFSEAVDDRVAVLAVAGTNMTITYNDGANTLTFDAAGASLADNSVTDLKLRDSVALSVIGRSANTTGDPGDIAAGTDGHVLRRSGTTLGFGTLAAGAFAADVITYAMIQNVSATDRVLGRSTAGAGDIEEIVCTAGGRALINSAGTANTFPYFSATDTVTLAAISADALNLLNDANFNAMRTSLGLNIGTNVQAFDTELAAIAGLTSAANQVPYFTGSGTAALAAFTAGGRAIVNSAGTANTFPYFSSADTITLGSITAAGRALLDDADAAAQLVTLGAAGQGLQTIWVPAGSMIKRTTLPPADYNVELGTNLVMVNGLAFDAAADEFAQFDVRFPKSWNEGTVTAEFRWTAPSGTGDVIWGLQGLARSNDDPLDTAFGTAILVTDTLLAANDEHQSPTTAAITIGGTPAEADRVIFQVYRDANAGGDTFSADAVLLGVTLFYTTNAPTDA